MNSTMLASILFALVVSLVFGRNASIIGHKLDVLDFPDTDGGRKRHELVTPMVGINWRMVSGAKLPAMMPGR